MSLIQLRLAFDILVISESPHGLAELWHTRMRIICAVSPRYTISGELHSDYMPFQVPERLPELVICTQYGYLDATLDGCGWYVVSSCASP